MGKRRRGDPRVIDGNRLCSPRDSDVRPKPTNGNIEGEDGVGPQSRFELEQTPPAEMRQGHASRRGVFSSIATIIAKISLSILVSCPCETARAGQPRR